MSSPANGMVERIGDDTVVWFVSDLHMGDGTPSDVFFGKDRHLMALVQRVEREGGLLVVAGDALDFHQAWTFTRIMRAHQELLGALSRLGNAGRLIYVIGNHDYDISLYRKILNFRVCEELHIGDQILVQHGYQYDPYISNKLHSSHTATKVHHLLERYLGTWLRIPLGEFYTLGNRVAFWAVHKIALVLLLLSRVTGGGESFQRQLDFWARSNMGDPMCIFRPVWDRVRSGPWRYIVCGHSHLPGIVRHEDRAYVNTGSWTFASSHYVRYDPATGFECRDWITGRQFASEFYRPCLDGSLDRRDFWTWWRENYMGWLRFREGEERRGRLRGWESFIRDHQLMARLYPLDRSPLSLGDGGPSVDDDTAASSPG